jgi:hypothetical protein
MTPETFTLIAIAIAAVIILTTECKRRWPL